MYMKYKKDIHSENKLKTEQTSVSCLKMVTTCHFVLRTDKDRQAPGILGWHCEARFHSKLPALGRHLGPSRMRGDEPLRESPSYFLSQKKRSNLTNQYSHVHKNKFKKLFKKSNRPIYTALIINWPVWLFSRGCLKTSTYLSFSEAFLSSCFTATRFFPPILVLFSSSPMNTYTYTNKAEVKISGCSWKNIPSYFLFTFHISSFIYSTCILNFVTDQWSKYAHV